MKATTTELPEEIHNDYHTETADLDIYDEWEHDWETAARADSLALYQ
jgi:hypothetical protein